MELQHPNQRLKALISDLILRAEISTQQDLAESLGFNKSAFSQIVNGRVPLTDSLCNKIKKKYPKINTEWLKTGIGDMYMNNSGVITGKNIISGTNHRINQGRNYTESECNKLLEIIYKKDEQIAKKDEQIAKKDEQIDKLLELLKNEK